MGTRRGISRWARYLAEVARAREEVQRLRAMATSPDVGRDHALALVQERRAAQLACSAACWSEMPTACMQRVVCVR